jgi:hypothetical protein
VRGGAFLTTELEGSLVGFTTFLSASMAADAPVEQTILSLPGAASVRGFPPSEPLDFDLCSTTCTLPRSAPPDLGVPSAEADGGTSEQEAKVRTLCSQVHRAGQVSRRLIAGDAAVWSFQLQVGWCQGGTYTRCRITSLARSHQVCPRPASRARRAAWVRSAPPEACRRWRRGGRRPSCR